MVLVALIDQVLLENGGCGTATSHVVFQSSNTAQRDKKDGYYTNRYGEGITLSNQKGLPTNNDHNVFVSTEWRVFVFGLVCRRLYAIFSMNILLLFESLRECSHFYLNL